MLTLPADLDLLQRRSHQVECRLWCRPPVGGDWVPLRTVAGTPKVEYAAAGQIPGRTLTATVLVDDDQGNSLLEAADHADDLLYAPMSIFGTWIRAEQIVYRYDGTTITVPWGVYRLDRMILDQGEGTIQITCPDALQQVADRKLVTLAMGRIISGQYYGARLDAMLAEVFGPGIPPWWTGPVFDHAGQADRLYGGVSWTQTDSRPDAAMAIVRAWAPGSTIIAPRTGSALKLIIPGSGNPAEVKAGGFGNLIGNLADEIDRGDMFNEVAVLYSVERALAGGVTQSEQRRAVAQYLTAWEELRADGPFGYVSRDAQTMDVADKTSPTVADAYARTAAAAAIGQSLTQRRPVSFSTSPIYGLEQGDPVTLQVEPGGPLVTGVLTAAQIPLDAVGGDWTLTIEVSKTLDRMVRARVVTVLDGLDWKVLRPARTIDLDTGRGPDLLPGAGVSTSWRGWTVTGQSTLRGGGALTATSNGHNIVAQSTDAWDEIAAEHQYRGWASVTAGKGAFSARVVVSWTGPVAGLKVGAWYKLTKGKSATLAVDTSVIPAAAARLKLRIETSGMAAGEQIRINAAGIQYAQYRLL